MKLAFRFSVLITFQVLLFVFFFITGVQPYLLQNTNTER